MNFEWDEAKATANSRKHKVTFEEASTIFADELSLTVHHVWTICREPHLGSFSCGARRRDSDHQREICDADGEENV